MKDIKGYEGHYAITEDGQVYSYKSKKFLKPNEARGYLKVKLSGPNRKDYYIHRLVAEAYLPNPDGLPEVNHKDENKLNNCVDNLEWCSREYNQTYGTRNQRSARNRSIPVYCVELNKVFEGAQQAARELGLNPSHIGECCKGKAKRHGGYHWQYAEENK